MFSHFQHPVTSIEKKIFALLMVVLMTVALLFTGILINQPASLSPTSTQSVKYMNPGGTSPTDTFTLNGNVNGTIIPITSNVNDRNQFLRLGLDKVNQEFQQRIAPNTELSGTQSVAKLIVVWINFFLGFYVLVAVLIFIYLGIRFLLSAGSDDKRKAITKMFTSLILGTFLIMCSYVIIQLILYFVGAWSGTS